MPAFRVHARGQGFEIGNSNQNLVADFTSAGVEVRSARGSWHMALTGYGYAGELAAVGAAHPDASANRVEYRRGPLTEWYVNGPLGLEQGFALQARPHERAMIAAQEPSQPLTLSFALSGNLTASVDRAGTGLTLSRNGEAVLQYSGLMARDAAGKDLRAWMGVQGKEMLLKIDDAKAIYPLSIDPWVQQAELTVVGATSNDYVGFSVALSGSTLVVGAPLTTVGFNAYQGAAYVFAKSGSGWANMTQTATLTASDGKALDQFGWSVSVSGNVIAVGAYGNTGFKGAVYVYVEPQTGGWKNATQSAKLTASNANGYDFLGYSVAISGNTIVAGAPNAQINAVNEGAGFVYVKPAQGWKTTSAFNAELTSADETSDAFFGAAVAIHGITVVIGDPYANLGSNQNQGAAYVYVQPTGGWTSTSAYTGKLAASAGQQYDNLGFSVATDGTSILVGATGVNSGQGAAYVYVKPTGGWTTMFENAELTASGGRGGDAFGTSVAISGKAAVVGAGNAYVNSNPLQGAAYLYLEPGTGWNTTSTFTAKLGASDASASAHFGRAVSVDSGTAAIGAYEGSNTGPLVGAAYVFGNM
ncbi:MAG TPA: FG-GAP repeat protein [Terriglobia bacterium]|nr:FG-GAP repeat protein [Terriglobia bacterium]